MLTVLSYDDPCPPGGPREMEVTPSKDTQEQGWRDVIDRVPNGTTDQPRALVHCLAPDTSST